MEFGTMDVCYGDRGDINKESRSAFHHPGT